MERPDDPAGVMQHAGRFKGGKALVVLGGYSGARWRSVYQEIKPDCVIGANGVNAMITGLDYWMICENMTRSARLAEKGDKRSIELMAMFHRNALAQVKLVSHWSWHLLKDKTNCINIRRKGYELEEIPGSFTFREYGEGFLAGGIFKHKEAWQPKVLVRAGTVGLQAIHMAGILGVSEVHTIGYDLMFKEADRHHWYQHPTYEADRFRTEKAFLNWKGISTQWAWVETAMYLKGIEYLFEWDNLLWVDHSDGLLKVEGLKCARETVA